MWFPINNSLVYNKIVLLFEERYLINIEKEVLLFGFAFSGCYHSG